MDSLWQERNRFPVLRRLRPSRERWGCFLALILFPSLLGGCDASRPEGDHDRSELFLPAPPDSGGGRNEAAGDLRRQGETPGGSAETGSRGTDGKSPGGWIEARGPRPFRFPEDHAAHPDYRMEWWYYTGNLETPEGRGFGYQLTFFRTGLHKDPRNPSRWAVRDLYTAHFAVSDPRPPQHHFFQRNSRGGLGLAGALSERLEVWNRDWKVFLSGDDHRLQAAEGEVAIDLTLTPQKPPVLHGDAGWSRKGATAGNASYYYSLTRMATVGTVRIGDRTHTVRGSSWMDHEFSTSFLEPGQLGWDWLSIQLNDGVDLMLYRMRRADGSTDPFSSGTLVGADGQVTSLQQSEYEMTSGEVWVSPQTGGKYPLVWTIAVPRAGYRLIVRPVFAAQEMATNETTGISYWEGAVEIAGEGPRGAVAGKGYMELTGYVGTGLGSLFD